MKKRNPAISAKNTPYYFIVSRKSRPKYDMIKIEIVDEDGNKGFDSRTKNNAQLIDLYGFIEAKKHDDFIYQISFAYVESAPKHGPLLYDLMMELVTLGDCYLTSDLEVSKDAKRIWSYYYKKRTDVSKKLISEIDPYYKHLLTREIIWRKSDSLIYALPTFEKKPGPNPLLYAYQKYPSTLLTLEKRGRIKFMG